MNLINGVKTNFKFAGIDKFDVNNGNGVGVTLFMQGCTHHCVGCHNKSTWDKNGGIPFTQKSFDELFKVLSNEVITRLTLSGGDPLDNTEFTKFICNAFKSTFPDKKLWIYTGYTYEHIMQNNELLEILRMCDVLVDGEFKIEEKDLKLKFRGSRNQRIIDVKESIKKDKIVII